MLKRHRRVAIAEEILEQVHNNNRLHVGTKKTYARVFASGALYLATNYRFIFNYKQVYSLYSFLPRSVVEHYIKLCVNCSVRMPQKTKPNLRPIIANGLFYYAITLHYITYVHVSHRLI